MKRLIFTFGVMGAWLCNPAAHAAAAAECFAKPAAVFAAHPNAAHVSYTLRARRGERCWYADAFNTEAKAKAKPTPRPVATVAQTSALRPAIAATESHPRATAVAPVPRPRTTAVAPAPRPGIVQFPREIPPAIQISVNAGELSRVLPVDETPADFESRFSVSGYKLQK
jgi:hypothetical protein